MESLPHILGACSLTHLARIRRHNDVCRTISRACKRVGWCVEPEPPVGFGPTFLKPDLVISRAGRAEVLEVTIAQDGYEEQAYDAKMTKYAADRPLAAFRAYATSKLKAEELFKENIRPIVFSQRGQLTPRSRAHLKDVGLSAFDATHSVLSVVAGSVRTHAAYHTSTFRL